ncbi:helix-turn-helix domain-containing protein [Sporomusa ovata]|uniref:Transcriptional regulator, AraC family n=2 Tax=Sporomusa ovata TaxID=2378 RepID=A0A0U1L2K8_9FIRM|nr:AraC family transcriptional regulator [Sporomusa ovata]CQR73886.1 Transcriptional regulator, AraC family [Sporomusa ovata]
MNDIKKEMYEAFMLGNGFYYDGSNTGFSREWTCFTLLPEKGKGHYWVYTFANLFSISVLDFVFCEDFYLEYPQPRFLDIGYYESVSGEELKPCKRFVCSGIRGHVGNNNLYQALYHKNIPLRSTSISIMPEYYEDYLRAKYPDEYENPQKAFSRIDGSIDFPELVLLLKQIKNCRLTGIAEKLYFESKVAEAVSLIVQKDKETTQHVYPAPRISQQDLDSLQAVTAYIDDHFAQAIRLDSLAKIACMGTTKLKYTFKGVYKTTISEYILNKRLSQAKYLLMSTDLNINQIAQIVGYKMAGSFSEIFRKNIGLLPNEYRKLSMVKG